MARAKRFHQDWMIYHVIIRCNNRQMLLHEEQTKMLLLKSFGEFQKRLSFKIYGFVIMDNHAHWLIQVQGMHGLSQVMQKVLLSFSWKFRKRNGYVGHFWQGRYKSRSIITDQSMNEVLNYVHNNPVKAKMVPDCKDYIFSSAFKYFDFPNVKVESVLQVIKYGDTSFVSYKLLTV